MVRGVHADPAMFHLVKCPESDELELVESVDTPLGNLIHRCSRFRPACALKCTRGCATALDEETRGRSSQPIRERDGHLELDCELEVEVEDPL